MSELKTKKSSGFFTYKGLPLVRNGNIIYYGNMSDKYVIMLQVLDTKKVGDLDVATKVMVHLQHTNPDFRVKDRVVKRSEKDGLWSAMDIASIWLKRALNEG